MRCKGGNAYLDYITDILNSKPGVIKHEMDNGYEFKIYNDVDKMIRKIKELDREYGLCRNVCSESWPWNTKGKKIEEIKQGKLYDIEIGPYKYYWNTRVAGWLVSENAINEIGCIHTIQGYDLNYVGLIFGQEIDYDRNTKKIVIDRNKFDGTYIKQGADEETFYNYIINAYKVIMTRGIKGCFIYAFNDGLRKYLEQFIDIIN